jgi:hypothetical protein
MKVLSETNEALAVAHLVFCFLVFPFAIALFRLRKKGIPSAMVTTNGEL